MRSQTSEVPETILAFVRALAREMERADYEQLLKAGGEGQNAGDVARGDGQRNGSPKRRRLG